MASELLLPDVPELASCSGTADAVITLAGVRDIRNEPECITIAKDKWYILIPDPQKFFMYCEGFDFEITGGHEIRVDLHDRAERADRVCRAEHADRGCSDEHADRVGYAERAGLAGSRATTFTLGTAFGVAGIQRGLVPIHGICVASGGTAVIITGYSGTGKSAVLSVLAQKGYRYLADDVVMVSVEDGKPYAIPAYPQRKIAADTALETGEDTGDAVGIVEDGRDKFAIRRQDEWLDKKLPLTGIVELSVRNCSIKKDAALLVEVSEIKGHAALELVTRNQYRRRFAEAIDQTLHRIKRLVDITSSVRTFRVTRPVSGVPVSDTADAIEGIIKDLYINGE